MTPNGSGCVGRTVQQELINFSASECQTTPLAFSADAKRSDCMMSNKILYVHLWRLLSRSITRAFSRWLMHFPLRSLIAFGTCKCSCEGGSTPKESLAAYIDPVHKGSMSQPYFSFCQNQSTSNTLLGKTSVRR